MIRAAVRPCLQKAICRAALRPGVAVAFVVGELALSLTDKVRHVVNPGLGGCFLYLAPAMNSGIR